MSVTCVIHHGEVDEADTVELPNGPVCTRCYQWMEGIMDGDDAENEGVEFVIVLDPDENDDDDD